MLRLNAPRLALPYPRSAAAGAVITFSHFLPHRKLPYPAHVPEMAKAVGCAELELQLDALRSSVHVYGHTHIAADVQLDGMAPNSQRRRYVHRPLTDPGAGSAALICVFDGSKDAGVMPPSK